jgi:hypothetical protein
MRFRFFDAPCGTVDGSPVSNHERLERELHPNADPGDPDAGEPIHDADEAREKAQQIADAAREQIEALGFECGEISFNEPLTPTQKFIRASDKRWGLNQTSTTDTSHMTQTQRLVAIMQPNRGKQRTSDTKIQRFIAASNKRWGIGQ